MMPDTIGYALLTRNASTIVLKKGKHSYKDLILYLGHEYGHVMDYQRWGDKKRWKLQTLMPEQSDFRKGASVEEKTAFLKTEVIAERYIPVFLKKFKVAIDYDKDVIRAQTFSSIISIKYELMYGKVASEELEQQWLNMDLHNPTPLDPKWLYNFNKLLK